jgi:hypothetical protein
MGNSEPVELKMNHYKIPKIDPLRIPIRFRPLDAILLASIAIAIAYTAITYSELVDLRKELRSLEGGMK